MRRESGDKAARRRRFASTLAIATVVTGAIVGDVWHLESARRVAAAALLLFAVLEAPGLMVGGRLMAAGCLLATLVAAMLLPHAGDAMLRGLEGAAFIVGLFASLGALREAAVTSPLIRQCGGLMVRQPPGRRFLALGVGAHLVSVVLNMGVLPLFGIMVMHGNTLEAAGGDARIAAIRKQRMMTALLQGYALMTVWSPLAVSFTIVQAAFPSLTWERFLPLQLALSVLMMGLSWLVDRLSFPTVARAAVADAPRSAVPAIRLVALILGIVAGAVALAVFLGVRPVVGAMIVVPASAFLWLTAQHWGGWNAPVAAAGALGRGMAVTLPASRNEFMLLGGATYLGLVTAQFLPSAEAAAMILRLPLPPVAVMVLLAWGLMALSRYGVPQIVTVTLLGHVMTELSQHGIDPLVLASGLTGAWALSACTSPVGAAALTVGRLAEVSARTVARDWNGRFVLSGAVLVALWMVVLDRL